MTSPLTRRYSSPDGRLRQFIYGPCLRYSTPDFPKPLELSETEGGHIGLPIDTSDPYIYVGLAEDGHVIHSSEDMVGEGDDCRPYVGAWGARYFPAHLVNKGDTGR